MMCEVLEKLERLTTELPPIPPLLDFRLDIDGITTYDFEGGVSTAQNLHSEKDIAIAKTYIPKGVSFSDHIHKVSGEWLIVLYGSLEVTTEEEIKVLNRHDSIKIEAHKPHSAKALESTIIIAITIPRDDGFPE